MRAEVKARPCLDENFLRQVYQTDELLGQEKRRRKEIAHLNQRIAHLEVELAQAQSQAAGRPFLSGCGVSDKAIKLYRKLAGKYHLDRRPETAEFMRDINELWQSLK